jgi:hypothetical protein
VAECAHRRPLSTSYRSSRNRILNIAVERIGIC